MPSAQHMPWFEALLEEFAAHHPLINTNASQALAVTTAAGNLVGGSKYRGKLVFCNIGLFDAMLDIQNAPTAAKGILLPAGGGILELTLPEDLALIQLPWYAIAIGGATTITVLDEDISR